MNYPLYRDFKHIQDWMDGFNSEKTQIVYLSSFNNWLSWLKDQGHDWNPDQIFDMRRQDLKKDDPDEIHRFEKLVRFYAVYLNREHPKAGWTVANKVKAIQSFFSANLSSLQFRRGELSIRRINKNPKKVPSEEQVKILYVKAEAWRDKALLLIMAQSGLSPVDASVLDIQELPDFSQDQPVYFRIIRHKTGQEARTFLHPETIYAINQMLELRGSPKKGPLFLSNHNNRLKPSMIKEIIVNIASKTNMDFTPKCFRDFFKTGLRKAQIDNELQDWIMGHKGSVGKGYGDVGPEELRSQYMKALPFLSVNGFSMQPKNEVERLSSRVKELEEGYADLLKKFAEWRKEIALINKS